MPCVRLSRGWIPLAKRTNRDTVLLRQVSEGIALDDDHAMILGNPVSHAMRVGAGIIPCQLGVARKL